MLKNRAVRYALIVIAAVVVVVVAAVVGVVASFDPNAYKGQVIAAVKSATGRDLVLNGKIGLKLGLSPTVQLEDVTFANPPGYSRPDMATLQRLDLQLALLPLLSHRVEVKRLIMEKPDILLETNAEGQPNWVFHPEQPAGVSPTANPAPPPAQAPPGQAPAAAPAQGQAPGQAPGQAQAPAQAPASAQTQPGGSAISGVSIGSMRIDDGVIAIRDDKTGSATSITVPKLDVSSSSPDSPMHIEANVTVDSAGYDLVADTGSADALQDPGASPWPIKVALTMTGRPLGDASLTLAGSIGPTGLLLSHQKGGPFQVDLTLQSAGASVSAKGNVADIHALSGVDVALAANIPDMAALSPLAGTRLPAVKTVAFQAQLKDAGGGLFHGAELHGLALTSPSADLAGDVAVTMAAKPDVVATLTSNRIDLDALQAAAGSLPGAPPPAAGAKQAPPPKPAEPPQPAAAVKTGGKRLFSDAPLPFDLLQKADADVTLNVADLHSGGADYKAIGTHAVVKDGDLTVDPFAADIPGGHLSGTLNVVASQPAKVHLTLNAPGLALRTLLNAFKIDSYANGNLEVYADLSGAGDSQHAIASTLDGYLGLAIPGGTIDSRLLGSVLGNVENVINQVSPLGKGGNQLKCFGARIDAEHGVATFKALALDSSILNMTGSGSVNLREETLQMTLRTQARLGGIGLLVPINLSGPIRDPSAKVNEAAAAEGNAGAVAGAVIGNATPLGIVGGLLGGDKALGGGGNVDVCPAALAAARGQAAPAAAEQAPAQQPAAKQPKPNAGAILKQLFR